MRPELLLRPHEKLLAALKPRVHLTLRRILRHLREETGAVVVVLVTSDKVVELAGDENFVPIFYPNAGRGSAAIGEARCLSDWTKFPAVSVRVRLVPPWPNLALHVVGPRAMVTAALCRVVEQAGEEIEDTLLEALPQGSGPAVRAVG